MYSGALPEAPVHGPGPHKSHLTMHDTAHILPLPPQDPPRIKLADSGCAATPAKQLRAKRLLDKARKAAGALPGGPSPPVAPEVGGRFRGTWHVIITRLEDCCCATVTRTLRQCEDYLCRCHHAATSSAQRPQALGSFAPLGVGRGATDDVWACGLLLCQIVMHDPTLRCGWLHVHTHMLCGGTSRV